MAYPRLELVLEVKPIWTFMTLYIPFLWRCLVRYEEQLREQQGQLQKEDLSDMVAEHAAKQKVQIFLIFN